MRDSAQKVSLYYLLSWWDESEWASEYSVCV